MTDFSKKSSNFAWILQQLLSMLFSGTMMLMKTTI